MTYSYDSINSMELESNTFVYAIGTRDDQGLFVYRYVGLTSRGATRLKQHLWGAKTVGSNTYNTYKAKWIRTVDFNVEFIVLEYCNSFEELTLCEQKWIANLKARGYKLTNLTNGGDGSLGWCPSPETRAKWSQNISGEKILTGRVVFHLRKKQGFLEINGVMFNLNRKNTEKRLAIVEKGKTTVLMFNGM